MEMASGVVDEKERGIISRIWNGLKGFPGKLMFKLVEFGKKIKKLGQDDPRRIIHSLKVGLAIILMSSFYYFEPLYDAFGVSAMWAVLTVVVVFEFSVGATLGRGLNRGLATFLAGTLGFGAYHLASLSGEKGEPILLGLFVFLLVAAVTFIRFFPGMKARYDYGLLVFILTFSLISVSVWARDDLHNLVANNIEKLANFLEGFGSEYFKISRDVEPDKKFLEGYKIVLNSKETEESLANFARWEPGHGQFRFRHPWKQYLKIGSLTRHCAYRIEALNDYLNTENQVPQGIRSKLEDPILNLSSELVKALKELTFAIKTMTTPSSVNSHIKKSKIAAKNLKFMLNTGLLFKETNLLEVIPAVTMASLLVDVISYAEKIAESVQELASLAKFKNLKPRVAPSRSSSRISKPEHVITIYQPSSSAE